MNANDRKLLKHASERMSGDRLKAITGKAAIVRALRAGWLEVDPEWNGCYRLTDLGYAMWEEA